MNDAATSPGGGRRFAHSLRVRYSECDPQGIVFNANWFMYFDTVTTELWRREFGGYARVVAEHGVETVVAETGARFRSAARFDDEIDFELTIPRVGDRSLRVEITGARGADLLVEGFLELVFVDAETFSPVPIPKPVLTALTDPTSEPSAT